MNKVKIISCGSYLPPKILTNNDISKTVDTNDEWITQRTGIKQRHIAENELTSDLGTKAALNCIKKAAKTHVDLILVATTTPDLTFPSTACKIQANLAKSGITSNAAFDIQAVCSGFLYGFVTANSFLKSGAFKSILLIGAETLSKIVDWQDRGTCILFGDGAGAFLLESHTSNEPSDILYADIRSDGSLIDILKTTGGTGSTQDRGFIRMEGKEVFKHATQKMTDAIKEALKTCNITKDEVDFVIAHQANERILDYISQKLEIPSTKLIKTINLHANTSAASIPLAFDTVVSNGLIKRGSKIVLTALGGGLTWGAGVFIF